MATIRPAAVVNSATQMPPDRIDGLTRLPAASRAWKASIMPITVPKSPIKGLTTAISARVGKPRRRPSRIAEATRVTSSRATSVPIRGSATAPMAAAITCANGPGAASTAALASAACPARQATRAPSANPEAPRRALANCIALATMIVAATRDRASNT